MKRADLARLMAETGRSTSRVNPKFASRVKTSCGHGHKHDSKREARRCDQLHLLQRSGEIAGLKSQPFFPFMINGKAPKLENGHEAGVTLDFSYVELPSGQQVAEDVKPRHRDADNDAWPLRKAIFRHIYPTYDLREVRT